MKSFTEAKGIEPFDWNEFLSKSLKDMLKENLEHVTGLADGWVTCACGVQCEIIPRGNVNQPLDEKLQDLGVQFGLTINRLRNALLTEQKAAFDYKDEAIGILKKIEKRSALLIRGIEIERDLTMKSICVRKKTT